jgi:glyoxylase-like metal-dependent hydrolase (beta-lactamase superfamily II)
MLKVEHCALNPFAANTYLVWDEASGEAALIDPAVSNEREREEMREKVEKSGARMKYIINTHGHIDHIVGNRFAVETFGGTLLFPSGDKALLDSAADQAKMFGFDYDPSPEPDADLNEETEITLGEERIRVFHTPGHSPGERSLLYEAGGMAFVGDVLFKGAIGRYDLWGGDETTLMETIKKKILSLPDETIIFAGHGDRTTVGEERRSNPFLASFL